MSGEAARPTSIIENGVVKMSTGTVVLIVLVALGLAVFWRTVVLAVVTGVIALLLVGVVALGHLDEGSCLAPSAPVPSVPAEDVR